MSGRASRWIPAALMVALLLLMLARTSSERVVFSRYSLHFSLFWLSLATWLAAWSWIARDDRRWQRLRGRTGAAVPVLAAIFGAILLADAAAGILEDLARAAASPLGILACLGVTAMLLILAAESPANSIKNLALATGSALVALAVAELVFRTLLIAPPPTSDRGFERWVQSRWPREVQEEKPAGTVRILGLADSFGVAGGADNYHYLVEALLKPRGDIVNLSVEASQLPDELRLLEERGARYRPDVVLHGFFVGNDFDVAPGGFKAFRGIRLEEPAGARRFRPHDFLLLEWIRKYSRAARAGGRRDAGTFSHADFLSIESRRLNRISRISPSRPEPAWQETLSAIDAIRKATSDLGAKYVMVIHPDQFQVETGLRQEVLSRYNLNPANYDFELPQQFLVEDCERDGVRCLDLLGEFRRHGAGGGLYLTRDTHYNSRGNQLAARLIAEFLASEGLVPPSR